MRNVNPDPLPIELLCHGNRGSATADRIEHHVAFDAKDVLWATAMRGFSFCDQIDAPLMRVDIEAGAATVIGYTHQGYNHGGDIPPVQVRVCHRKGNGGYVPITIDMASLPDHRAHGDIVPGVDSTDCSCPGTGGHNQVAQ